MSHIMAAKANTQPDGRPDAFWRQAETLSPRRQARGYKHTHSSIADSNDDFLQIIFVVQRLGSVGL